MTIIKEPQYTAEEYCCELAYKLGLPPIKAKEPKGINLRRIL